MDQNQNLLSNLQQSIAWLHLSILPLQTALKSDYTKLWSGIYSAEYVLGNLVVAKEQSIAL